MEHFTLYKLVHWFQTKHVLDCNTHSNGDQRTVWLKYCFWYNGHWPKSTRFACSQNEHPADNCYTSVSNYRVPPCSQTVALLVERCRQVMCSYTIGNKSSMQKEQTGWVISICYIWTSVLKLIGVKSCFLNVKSCSFKWCLPIRLQG